MSTRLQREKEKRVVRHRGGSFSLHASIPEVKKQETLTMLKNSTQVVDIEWEGSRRVCFRPRVASIIKHWLCHFLEQTDYKDCCLKSHGVKVFANDHDEKSRKNATADSAIHFHKDGFDDSMLTSVVASLSQHPSSISMARTKDHSLNQSAKNKSGQTETVVVPDGTVHVFPGSHVTHGATQSGGWRKAVVGFFLVKRNMRRRVLEILHQNHRVCVACNVSFRSAKGEKQHACEK